MTSSRKARSQGNRPSRECGASFVEIALMLPVALFLIYVLIYYCFTLIAEGTAEYTIHKALQTAIVAPELENIPVPQPSDCFTRAPTCQNDANATDEDKFCCSLSNIKHDIVKNLGEGFIAANGDNDHFAYLEPASGQSEAIRIIIPQDNGKGVSAADNPLEVLKEIPIRLEVDFAIKPIFYGLPPIRRTVRTGGFYEVQSALSYPVPIDCMGNAYGSADYNHEGCECAEDNATLRDGSCKACKWGSIPKLEGHQSLGEKPEGYEENPHYGCWCPTAETCKEKLNNTAGALKWKSGTGCGCHCNWWRTFRGDGKGGCRCNNSLGDYNYTERETHNGFTQWLGQPENELSMGATALVDGKCSCTTKEEVSVTYPADYKKAELAGQTITAPAGSTFSQTHCDYLWGPGVTRLETQGGCECGCPRPDCGPGRYFYPDADAGPCAGECKCWKPTGGSIIPNPKEKWDGNKCVCDPDHPDVEECPPVSDCDEDGNSCRHKTYKENSCECICDDDYDCGANAHIDDNCQCVCSYNPLIPYSAGACPSSDDGNGTG